MNIRTLVLLLNQIQHQKKKQFTNMYLHHARVCVHQMIQPNELWEFRSSFMFNPLIVEGLCGVCIGGLAVIKQTNKQKNWSWCVAEKHPASRKWENTDTLFALHYFLSISFFFFIDRYWKTFNKKTFCTVIHPSVLPSCLQMCNNPLSDQKTGMMG